MVLDSFDVVEQRLWATLCFRLGVLLTEYGLTSLHQRGNHLTEELLKRFNQEKGHADTKTALVNCIDLCKVAITDKQVNPNAARLLVGYH